MSKITEQEARKLIERYAGRDPQLVDLLVRQMKQESAFDTEAVSHAGARGLMQIMPATARAPGFGVEPIAEADLFDPHKNTRFGVAYMRALLDRYNGDPDLALVAYNWGAGNADKIKRGEKSKLPAETADYVKRITGSEFKSQHKPRLAVFREQDANPKEQVSPVVSGTSVTGAQEVAPSDPFGQQAEQLMAELNVPRPTNVPRPVNSPHPANSLRPMDSPHPVDAPRPMDSPHPVSSPRPMDSPHPPSVPRPVDVPRPVASGRGSGDFSAKSASVASGRGSAGSSAKPAPIDGNFVRRVNAMSPRQATTANVPFHTPETRQQPSKLESELTLLDSFKIGAESENMMVGAAKFALQLSQQQNFKPDSGFDPFVQPEVKDDADMAFRLSGTKSREEFEFQLNKINQEKRQRQVFDESDNTVAKYAGFLAGAVISPESAIPIVGQARRFSRGAAAISGLRRGAVVGLATEGVLMLSQDERTLTEAGAGIGAMAGLGMLGGVMAPVKRVPKRSEGTLRVSGKDFAGGKGLDDEVPHFDAATAGAAAVKTHRRNFERDVAWAQPVETGTGIERIPIDPRTRLSNSGNVDAIRTVGGLVESGGTIRKEQAAGLRVERGGNVESNFKRRHLYRLKETMVQVEDVFAAYRGINADTAGRRAFGVAFSRLRDATGAPLPNGKLTHYQFREAVAKTARNKGRAPDALQLDETTREFVEKAAEPVRKLYDEYEKLAFDEELFTRGERNFVRKMKEELADQEQLLDEIRRGNIQQDAKLTQKRIRKLERKIREAKQRIAQIERHGPTQNTAPSYVNRIWRKDRILADRGRLEAIFRAHLLDQDPDMSPVTVSKSARKMVDSILDRKPVREIGDDDLVPDSSAFIGREIDVPDHLVEDFLENDIEMLMRAHVQQVGMDIELSRMFGDPGMVDQISIVRENADARIQKAVDEGASVDEIKKIENELAADIRDIRAIRDRLRGTYGMPQDPMRLQSRGIRIAKSLAALAFAGGFMVSSLPDIVRPVMVEGLNAQTGGAYRAFFAKQNKLLRAMNRQELQLAGTAMELETGLRAMQMADLGDTFGVRFPIERKLQAATDAMFTLNGLNWWNQSMKEIAGFVIASRMADDVIRWKNVDNLTPKKRLRLQRYEIDKSMADRIAQQLEEHRIQVNGGFIANTEGWTDAGAREAYRNALQQEVDRAIVTPSAGDRSLWMSTELGSMIGQFKGFGMATVTRVLTSGMQEKDAAFWVGASLLVAMGGVTNEIKAVLGGYDTSQLSFEERMFNAVDRSGILGSFMDINNALMNLSNNKIGAQALFSDQPPTTARQFAGTTLGPSGSFAFDAASIMGDIVTGSADSDTARKAFRMTPGNSLPYVQPLGAMVFRDGIGSDRALEKTTELDARSALGFDDPPATFSASER